MPTAIFVPDNTAELKWHAIQAFAADFSAAAGLAALRAGADRPGTIARVCTPACGAEPAGAPLPDNEPTRQEIAATSCHQKCRHPLSLPVHS